MHPARHAQTDPDRPAIIMARTGDTITFAELENVTRRLAQAFRGAGLKTGDHIAMMLENDPLLLEICFAATRAGLFITPISTRLTAEEAAYIVTDSGSRLFITSSTLSETARAISPLLSKNVRCWANGAVQSYQPIDAIIAAQPASPISDQAAGTYFFYSSGTTGRPKGVKRALPAGPYDAENPLDQLVKGLYGFGPGMVYLNPAPLYHSGPLSFTLAAIGLGGSAVIMDKFDPETALDLIERYRVTHSQWVPTMFTRMLRLPPETRKSKDISSLQVAIHAAAPCPPEVKRKMIDWWGDRIVEYYSGTEGAGLCVVTAREWLERPGTVGMALKGEIHILDDDGHEQPTGQPGMIYFGGGEPFEYHNEPEKTRAARTEQGWSTLGDVGYVDDDGYLYLTDRKDFMIISGGVNIYPTETENALLEHPSVVDVAVIGVPNEEFGEEVKAIIQPVDLSQHNSAFAEELIAFCRQRLADVKCPRSVDFVAELPRLPTGKLQKKLLREPYWAGRQSRIA